MRGRRQSRSDEDSASSVGIIVLSKSHALRFGSCFVLNLAKAFIPDTHTPIKPRDETHSYCEALQTLSRFSRVGGEVAAVGEVIPGDFEGFFGLAEEGVMGGRSGFVHGKRK